MYPFICFPSLVDFDEITISKFLLSQPEKYIKTFTAFEFDSNSVAEQLYNPDNYFVLIFDEMKEQLLSISFIRFHPDYKNATSGNVTDYHYQNKGLGQLGLAYLKSYCRMNNLNSEFVAHIDPTNESSMQLAKKSGIGIL